MGPRGPHPVLTHVELAGAARPALEVSIAAEVGRVIYAEDPDDADTWHTGVGGGLWLSFFRHRQTLSLAIVNGDDLTGVYLRAGLTV